jgi:hypothetical protein
MAKPDSLWNLAIRLWHSYSCSSLRKLNFSPKTSSFLSLLALQGSFCSDFVAVIMLSKLILPFFCSVPVPPDDKDAPYEPSVEDLYSLLPSETIESFLANLAIALGPASP